MTQEASTGILGISLIDDQLRIVEGIKHTNEFRVTQIAQGRIRQPFTFDIIADKNAARRFAEDITRLYETQEFKVKEAAFSLDSRMVLIKKIAIDQTLAAEQLEEHVKWEVRQFAISPIHEYVIDFEQLNSATNGFLKDILVVIVRKKIVKFLKQVFKHTNLKLKVVDVDIFSAQRALQLNYDYNSSDKIVLIELEDKRIHLSVLKGRNFFLTQDLSSISNSDEAGTSKESTTRLISKELKRIIIDHQLGKSVEDLNEIFLYGEAVDDHTLEELQNSYDVRIDRANPFRKVKLLAKAKEDISQSRAERYMISVGAALRGIQ